MNVAVPAMIKPLRAEVAAELKSIRPSISAGSNLFPCQATLDDGSVHPRVYLVDAIDYYRDWGRWPWERRGKQWLPVEKIVSVVSSPFRLPAEFANELYAEGESGQGYFAFAVDLVNGERRYFATGSEVDFPCWWAGFDPAEIVAVHPHHRDPDHRYRAPTAGEASAEYLLSPFRE